MFRVVSLLLATLIAVSCSSAQAHFIWLVPQPAADGTSVVRVYFGEDAHDDSTDYLSRLKGLQLQQVGGRDAPTMLSLESSDEGLAAAADCHQSVVVTSHDLGVMDRGDSVFRLQYYAKAGPVVTDGIWTATDVPDQIRLDIRPQLKDGELLLEVLFDQKPVAEAQVMAARPGLADFEGTTNQAGQVAIPVAESGLHSVRVRHIEAAAGELDGQKYPETRHYSTVALRIPESVQTAETPAMSDLPQPVTSFGAAVLGDALFMYGGHTGGAHSYSTKEQSNTLTRLDLKTGEWSSVIDGPHLQGLALVAHGGRLYRVGGFTAMNDEGEDHDLWSQDSVACFSPDADAWVKLPSLPERRSSHDAAVVGDCIYVVGGWAMQGEDSTEWHSTAWKMDLTKQEPAWESIAAPPFRRRAVALAAHDGKLFVVGGMQEEGGPTVAVGVYDPATDEWSDGPDLIVQAAADNEGESGRNMAAGRMAGFGASAFATGGALYVTTVQGLLQRLSQDGTRWELVSGEITPRFFHRLLPLDDHHLIAVGGSNMSIGKFSEVDIIDVREGT